MCSGGTVVCIGTGPSLTQADVDYCLGRAHVIVVNDAWLLAPWAHILYAADSQWWYWNRDVADAALPLRRYTIDPQAREWRPSVELLNYANCSGLSPTPDRIYSGGHGGFQAIQIAAHLIGTHGRIVLLGYDMMAGPSGRHHATPEHPDGSHPTYQARRGAYATLLKPLADRRISIVNASRQTAIQAIPRATLQQALEAA